jgi:hypothetical protein
MPDLSVCTGLGLLDSWDASKVPNMSNLLVAAHQR